MPALQSASLAQSRTHAPNAEHEVPLGHVPPQSQMPPGALRAHVPPAQSAFTRHWTGPGLVEPASLANASSANASVPLAASSTNASVPPAASSPRAASRPESTDPPASLPESPAKLASVPGASGRSALGVLHAAAAQIVRNERAHQLRVEVIARFYHARLGRRSHVSSCTGMRRAGSIAAVIAGCGLLASACASPTQPHADAGASDDAGSLRDTTAPSDGAATDTPLELDAGGPPLVRDEDFAEATGDVRNPDRGLYWLDWNEASALVLVEYSLADQCDVSTLPTTLLDDLRARLAGHRAGGRRAIVRFVYANDGVLNRCGLADADGLDRVLGHVAQLAPVLDEYEDVIAFFQAGLFGMWGEWNQEYAPAGTSLSLSQPNRDALIHALLDAVPARRSVELRRPRFRDELAGTPAELARIGFHDDCFLASDDDFGTYDGARTIDEWKTYLETVTLTSPAGGETCLDAPAYTSCTNALAEMARLRFSYVHEGYHPDVIARWTSEGCLEEIRQRLGYRLVVRAVEAPSSIAPGELLRVRVELENVGFAPPYDERRVQIVLRDASGTAVMVGAPIDVSATSWAAGAVSSFTVAATLPTTASAGSWEVRLALLEDASDLPAYAMLFANDARVRDDVRRENVVAHISVVP